MPGQGPGRRRSPEHGQPYPPANWSARAGRHTLSPPQSWSWEDKNVCRRQPQGGKARAGGAPRKAKHSPSSLAVPGPPCPWRPTQALRSRGTRQQGALPVHPQQQVFKGWGNEAVLSWRGQGRISIRAVSLPAASSPALGGPGMEPSLQPRHRHTPSRAARQTRETGLSRSLDLDKATGPGRCPSS